MAATQRIDFLDDYDNEIDDDDNRGEILGNLLWIQEDIPIVRHIFPLYLNDNDIGRGNARAVDVTIPDESVSNVHAILTITEKLSAERENDRFECVCKDISSNGTFIESYLGSNVFERPRNRKFILDHGFHIKFGNVVCRFIFINLPYPVPPDWYPRNRYAVNTDLMSNNAMSSHRNSSSAAIELELDFSGSPISSSNTRPTHDGMISSAINGMIVDNSNSSSFNAVDDAKIMTKVAKVIQETQFIEFEEPIDDDDDDDCDKRNQNHFETQLLEFNYDNNNDDDTPAQLDSNDDAANNSRNDRNQCSDSSSVITTAMMMKSTSSPNTIKSNKSPLNIDEVESLKSLNKDTSRSSRSIMKGTKNITHP